MKRILTTVLISIGFASLFAQGPVRQIKENIPLDSIRLSDPFILADKLTATYYMTGTGGLLWKSKDLSKWTGPYEVTQTDPKSWMGPRPMIWAAELHPYKGKYYYFATFTNRSVNIDTVKGNIINRRASHVLVSDQPTGPYVPMKDEIYLPAEEPTLDGTFWVDRDGKPYMVYCYEWLQNWNGTIEKIELKPDLSGSIGEGKVLFHAHDSPWSKEKDENGNVGPNKVTDGPYLFKTQTGKLGMIWTSWAFSDYVQGVAYSGSGTLDGPWIQQKEPITPPNFGHGMLFRTFDGKLLMSVHSHKSVNGRTIRVPHLFEMDDSGDRLVVKGLYKTLIQTNEKGELLINVSPSDALKFKANGFVRYSDFGAKGDGKTDDIDAIAAAHEFANQQGLPVKADEGATYYIGGKNRTAVIRTDTDFGNASFIINDTLIQNRNANVFMVSSSLITFKPEGITSLKRNQEKINVSFPATCLVTVTNSNVKRYIRFGANQNNGSSQTDIFIVDKDGKLDKNAPIIWDFDKITDITALPMDETTLTIKGGHFTTIANKAESKYNYYGRGIAIRRSNVIVDGLEHRVIGEGDHGAPYGGFINIGDCAYVTVRNTILTGHKVYETIGSAGVTVSMGTYDISINRALNVSFVNCSQTNDINDRKYWGILGSNYCKNLVYDHCVFSRFDAHMGVANATIRNSTLGHQGINAIGSGTFLVENSTIYGSNLINLRSDYGSTWQGEFIIRNCIFIPSNGKNTSVSLIGGSYSGQHDFGYICYMPERITIENLRIDDSKHSADYKGPSIFANFNPGMTSDSYVEKFPYVKTKEVILRNVTIASSKALRVSDNPFMFKEVKVNSDQ